jgi:hypothetical protein
VGWVEESNLGILEALPRFDVEEAIPKLNDYASMPLTQSFQLHIHPIAQRHTHLLFVNQHHRI